MRRLLLTLSLFARNFSSAGNLMSPTERVRMSHVQPMSQVFVNRSLHILCEALLRNSRKNINEVMLELTGTDISLCPSCKKGTMRTTEVLLPVLKMFKPVPVFLDSS